MKIEDNKILDDLFLAAKEQQPALSFDEVARKFNLSVNTPQTTNTWWKQKFNLNLIIVMISTISILALIYMVIPVENLQNKNDQVSEQQNELKPIQNIDNESINYQSTALVDKQDEIIINETELPINKVTPVEILENNKSTINEVVTNNIEDETNISEIGIVKKDTVLTIRCFKITNKSTIEELEELKLIVEKAGIKLTYKVKRKGDFIKMINLHFYITKADGTEIEDTFYFKGSRFSAFSYAITWRENEKGQAFDFNGEGSKSRIQIY